MHGIPFTLKDNFETSGMRAGASSPEPLRFLASADCGGLPTCRATRVAFETLLGRLAENGAVVRKQDRDDFDFQAARLSLLHISYAAIGAAMPPMARFLARRLGGMTFLDPSLNAM